MAAGIAGVATVDGQRREVERPWKTGIPVYKAIAEWVERAKRQPLDLDPALGSPPEGVVAHRGLCQEGSDPGRMVHYLGRDSRSRGEWRSVGCSFKTSGLKTRQSNSELDADIPQ